MCAQKCVCVCDDLFTWCCILFSVTLQASSSLAQFKGFLLETRDTVGPGVNPTASWGSFSLLQPNISQLLHCGGKQVTVIIKHLRKYRCDSWQYTALVIRPHGAVCDLPTHLHPKYLTIVTRRSTQLLPVQSFVLLFDSQQHILGMAHESCFQIKRGSCVKGIHMNICVYIYIYIYIYGYRI